MYTGATCSSQRCRCSCCQTIGAVAAPAPAADADADVDGGVTAEGREGSFININCQEYLVQATKCARCRKMKILRRSSAFYIKEPVYHRTCKDTSLALNHYELPCASKTAKDTTKMEDRFREVREEEEEEEEEEEDIL
ncbi:uncharacterized protein LOC105664156 isoform X2 [Megachile rotundata]